MADLQAREKQLRERLAVLEERLHRIEAHLEQPADKNWEENATASEMDEVLDELGHAGNAEVQAIYAALERLKYGTYGICARCGATISEERLNVLPHTPLCKSCAREVSQKR
jgi:RNA polymerase-binding transcription factor DksA